MTAQEQTFMLWREITLGVPATLTIAPLVAVQDAWRESGMMAAIDAANDQGPDLWRSITTAGTEAVSRLDSAEFAEMTRQVNQASRSKTRMGAIAAANAKARFNAGSCNRVMRAWGLDETT